MGGCALGAHPLTQGVLLPAPLHLTSGQPDAEEDGPDELHLVEEPSHPAGRAPVDRRPRDGGPGDGRQVRPRDRGQVDVRPRDVPVRQRHPREDPGHDEGADDRHEDGTDTAGDVASGVEKGVRPHLLLADGRGRPRLRHEVDAAGPDPRGGRRLVARPLEPRGADRLAQGREADPDRADDVGELVRPVRGEVDVVLGGGLLRRDLLVVDPPGGVVAPPVTDRGLDPVMTALHHELEDLSLRHDPQPITGPVADDIRRKSTPSSSFGRTVGHSDGAPPVPLTLARIPSGVTPHASRGPQ